MNQRTSELLVDQIAADPALQARLQADPLPVLREVSQAVTARTPRALEADPWVYRIIVLALAGVILTAAAGSVVIALVKGQDAFVPSLITSIASTAIGALAGILVPRS